MQDINKKLWFIYHSIDIHTAWENRPLNSKVMQIITPIVK
jgi:hypothetical protein